MMKTLMTATAVAALVAASPAFGQTQDLLQDPMAGESPAAESTAPDATAPEAMPSEPAQPEAGAAVEGEDQPETAESEDQPDEAVASGDKFVGQQAEDEALASVLIGTSVQNPAGEALGNINDLVLSEDGQVNLIVIGIGGFLGIGEKNVGVAFEAIEKSTDADGNPILILDASFEEMEAAPTFVTIRELQQEQEAEQPAAPAPAPDAMAPAAPEPSQ